MAKNRAEPSDECLVLSLDVVLLTADGMVWESPCFWALGLVGSAGGTLWNTGSGNLCPLGDVHGGVKLLTLNRGGLLCVFFFPDVQKLMACGLDKPPKDESRSGEDTLRPVPAERGRAEPEEGDAAVPLPTLSITPAHGTALTTTPG